MMYKVIKFFTDLLDNNHPYNVGDVFPHEGCSYPVSEDRLAELAGSSNKQGVPLIELVKEPVKEAPKKAPAKRAKKTTEE